ncbi:hypothetical protein GEV33_006680 [Tenebrio molitor]|uniref:Uncharacterized protein n=1 Tax=Tenebrio molitor TaxID=7067 RepID=A0A8J6LD08_TENMO|nr:hypothetical protein GEV33_006680 [Tenebrio molitor]
MIGAFGCHHPPSLQDAPGQRPSRVMSQRCPTRTSGAQESYHGIGRFYAISLIHYTTSGPQLFTCRHSRTRTLDSPSVPAGKLYCPLKITPESRTFQNIIYEPHVWVEENVELDAAAEILKKNENRLSCESLEQPTPQLTSPFRNQRDEASEPDKKKKKWRFRCLPNNSGKYSGPTVNRQGTRKILLIVPLDTTVRDPPRRHHERERAPCRRGKSMVERLKTQASTWDEAMTLIRRAHGLMRL